MFEILRVDPRLSDSLEQMGSKAKFWYHDETLGKSLFKASRPGTGENWAEKVSEQLCELIGLPHARYELAVCESAIGTVSPTFLDQREILIHGNELLVQLMPGYQDQSNVYARSGHTISRIFTLVSAAQLPSNWTPPEGILKAEDVFVGYLMLDAWICNGDRHDQNWGLVFSRGSEDDRKAWRMYLAPTFDHASSLGRNESDAKREFRLTTKDGGQNITAYLNRSRSAIYLTESESKPLLTLECFKLAAMTFPGASQIWLDSLSKVTPQAIDAILDSVPESIMSKLAKQFAREMLILRQDTLLKEQK